MLSPTRLGEKARTFLDPLRAPRWSRLPLSYGVCRGAPQTVTAARDSRFFNISIAWSVLIVAGTGFEPVFSGI